MKKTTQHRKYAVIDLEATGTGPDAKIIQVGIVMIEDGQIGATFASDVNPHEPLSEHIKNLTGITDAQLAQAPDFSQIAKQIFDLIGDAVFVAHNVKFDANLLAEMLMFEGYDLLTPRIDTVELAQVFFPSQEKYSLGSLTESLGIELTQAHTAIADAMATAELFLKIQAKIHRLPAVTLAQLRDLADCLLYESRWVLDEARLDISAPLPSDLEMAGELVLRRQLHYTQARQLSQDVTTNLALLNLTPRPQQLAFAEYVAEGLAAHQVQFVEAQSGIGKTYGYLLPLLAQSQARQIIVAVPTKLLQDQIMAQEGRALSETFHLNFYSLKGPDNYLNLDRFWQSLKAPHANRLVGRYKMQLLVWLTETTTGDLAEVSQKQRYPAYFNQIQHDGQVAKTSSFWGYDFWQRGQERLQQSQVIITNHAYLLTRMEDNPDFVANKVLVIDEAQKLFLTLEQFSRYTLSLSQWLYTLQQQISQAQTTLQRRLLESLQFHLSQLVKAYQTSQTQPQIAQIQAIRQDLLELDQPDLVDLQACFAEHYGHFWLSSSMMEGKRQLHLTAARLDFLKFSDFLPDTTQLLCVSATLQLSKKVAVAHLLGFDQAPVAVVPSQPQQHQELIAVTNAPDMTQMSETAYATFIAEQLAELSQLNQPILVLFNAISTLLKTSQQLDDLQIPHLSQHLHGEAYQLKRRFDRGETQLLLGTGAFWEGVDFANQPQLIEVITRIPFDNPKDLFVKKVNDTLRAAGQHPFYDYSLPMAILRMKQAIGRSKRHVNQASAVLLFDGRLFSKRYGQQIRQALAQHQPLTELSHQQLSAHLQTFFENVQPPQATSIVATDI